jgi:hypothetical protein
MTYRWMAGLSLHDHQPEFHYQVSMLLDTNNAAFIPCISLMSGAFVTPRDHTSYYTSYHSDPYLDHAYRG